MKKGNGFFWIQFIVGGFIVAANVIWGMNEWYQYKKNRAEKAAAKTA